MGEMSEVMKIRVGSPALRTTIPPGIRGHMGLKDGDLLEWTLEANDGKIVVKVTKKGASNKK